MLGRGFEQPPGQLEGLGEFLPFSQHLDVIDMHPHVLRLELVGGLQQELGVRQGAEADADVRQQAQSPPRRVEPFAGICGTGPPP